MPNPVAATSRIATTAAPARNGGRGVGSALCAPSRLPGLLDWVILGPPIGRLMRGGEFCSGNVRDPCAIGRKWGVVPAQGFPQPADADGQTRGGARAWNIWCGVAARTTERSVQSRCTL